MNQRSEISSAEIERLLMDMVESHTLHVELTDTDIDLLLASTPSTNQAEQFTEQALLKMQAAQRRREQKFPSFALGQQLANARLRTGLTLSQVAGQTSVSSTELEELEKGTWSVEQIMQKFSTKIMVRVLDTIHMAVWDFSDELLELTNTTSLKFTQSTISARSRHFQNTNSTHLIDKVTDYISEMQRLSS